MKYCTRCVYPENSAVPMYFDDKGICSGCRVAEEKNKIDWVERKKCLRSILNKYKDKGSSPYDCIIPVSGGKDSHYQTHLITKEFGLRPLVVTFNHEYNSARGIRNLTNLVTKLGVDNLRFTPNPQLIKKMALLSLKKMGDMAWHSHCGIFTFPVQIAVKYKIPLIIWGEQGFLDLGGMFSYNDLVEMTKKFRVEHGLRGYDWEDMVSKEYGITEADLEWAKYPSDKEIATIGVRGIYLGNYIPWNAKNQTELMIKLYGFETGPQPRTYNPYENVEDRYANGTNDYLRYLKFGYGRTTDHTSQDIRLGRLTREEGIKLVIKYDHQRPKDLDIFLKWAGITEKEFLESIDSMRDSAIWQKNSKGIWHTSDNILNHIHDQGVEEAKLPLNENENFNYKITKPIRKEPYHYTTL